MVRRPPRRAPLAPRSVPYERLHPHALRSGMRRLSRDGYEEAKADFPLQPSACMRRRAYADLERGAGVGGDVEAEGGAERVEREGRVVFCVDASEVSGC